MVPRSVRLAEAPSHGRPIARYAPDSRGATAYRALATELEIRLDQEAGRHGVVPDSVPAGAALSATTPRMSDASLSITVPRPHLPLDTGAGASGGVA